MSSSSRVSSLAAAAVFAILCLVALLAGLPRRGESEWQRRAADLRALEKTMAAEASLHKPVQLPPLPQPAPYCSGCHTVPPHGGRGIPAALLNHHSVLFDCLVCHWSKVSGPQPGLRWEPQGGEGGTGDKGLQILRLDVAEGPTGTYYSQLREGVTGRQECFDRGPRCGTCHRRGGMDRFLGPGLSSRTREALEKLPDFFSLTESKKWYFPQRP